MSTVLAHSTILCIDDEELPLSLRKQVLESAGYIVFTATNAIQGLEVFKANSINLVITDHLLGPGRRSALVRELRHLSSSLPIYDSLRGQHPPRRGRPARLLSPQVRGSKRDDREGAICNPAIDQQVSISSWPPDRRVHFFPAGNYSGSVSPEFSLMALSI